MLLLLRRPRQVRNPNTVAVREKRDPIHPKVRSTLGKVWGKEIEWFFTLILVCSQTDKIKHF